jgi:hypothetical protein
LRGKQEEWVSFTRSVVAAFRADAARTGAVAEIAALVEKLSAASPEFAQLWQENEVTRQAEGVKHLKHPKLGAFQMEYTSFAVDPAVAEKLWELTWQA